MNGNHLSEREREGERQSMVNSSNDWWLSMMAYEAEIYSILL